MSKARGSGHYAFERLYDYVCLGCNEKKSSKNFNRQYCEEHDCQEKKRVAHNLKNRDQRAKRIARMKAKNATA